MEKKYKELNASATLSPYAILQRLIQTAQTRANGTSSSNGGFKIFLKPNELKTKE